MLILRNDRHRLLLIMISSDNLIVYQNNIYVWIFETVSSLAQNFFACLPAIAGREALAVLEKAGGVPSRRVGAESPEHWLAAATIEGRQALSPGGWGGSQRVTFCSVKGPIFFVGQPWPDMPCRLRARKPASQTQARLVSRLCVDRLSVVDWRKNPVYFPGKVSGW